MLLIYISNRAIFLRVSNIRSDSSRYRARIGLKATRIISVIEKAVD